MGNVFVHTMMSLDGFIAGPNDDMSWVFRHAGDMPGAVVGRGHRQDWGGAGRPPRLRGRPASAATRGARAGRRTLEGPHFILTHAPPTDETDPSYSFLSGDVRDAVATSLTAAGGRDVLVLGANVVNQCLGVGLVDEILMHVVPELVGGRGAVVRCLDASCFARDARRVGIRSSREPAIAS